MILVNVKKQYELDRVMELIRTPYPIEVGLDKLYGYDTVLFIREMGIGYHWSQQSFSYAQAHYPNEKILSFDEFVEYYYPEELYSQKSNELPLDNVNSPSHYKQFSREVIDTMRGVSTPEEFKGYLKLNAIKYLSRYQGKNGAEDLAKAVWYINKLKEVVENEKASEAN